MNLNDIIKKVYCQLSKDYVINKTDSAHNVLVTYISEPFFKQSNSHYLNKHQNRREVFIIADVLDQLKCSYRFMRLDKTIVGDNNYDVVFGCGPAFIEACKKNPSAKKVYYATGSYYEHQNCSVIRRTDQFNREKTCTVPYYRLAAKLDSNEIADSIFQIGSRFTLETYPESLRQKIRIIRQTSFCFRDSFHIDEKIRSANKNNFIFMGSKGSLLKGVDIVLDFFLSRKDLQLSLFGTLDNEVLAYYKPLIDTSPNINFYGFQDMSSDIIYNTAMHSAWVVMPSSSEGCPGSVINMMKLGCIPIVSRNAAFDGIETCGILLKDISVESLSASVHYALALSDEEMKKLIISSYKFASENFNETTFRQDLLESFSKVFENE